MTDELKRLAAEKEAAWSRVRDAAESYNEARAEFREAVNAEYEANRAANCRAGKAAKNADN